jgi:hypothetical protein
MFTANKPAFMTLASQLIGQSQAAHDMTRADLDRSVSTENNIHRQLTHFFENGL